MVIWFNWMVANKVLPVAVGANIYVKTFLFESANHFTEITY